MTTSAETQLGGYDAGRPSRLARSPHKALPYEDWAEGSREGELPRAEYKSVGPGLAALAVCVGAAATVGGLAIAAVVRPQSPGVDWFVATIVLAALGGILAAPALHCLEQRRARSGQ